MTIRFYLLLLVGQLITLQIASAQDMLTESMMTVPERTAYGRTSTHAEVLQTIENLTGDSLLVHRETMLTTTDGKDVPLLIVANPAVTNPQQARASGKPVIYIQGNIHGGEVEGKEAILILLRDILHGDKSHLLDNQIIALAPIYNADGNDELRENSRPNQELSPVMAGERFSHGYDLNRDGVAVETPETRGLYRNVLQRWDPQLFVDMHTTNGTWHGYALTYAPSYHTAGDPAPTDYTMNVMLPAIAETVKEKFDLDFFLFGDFSLQDWPPTEFRTFHHAPRYLTNMIGLRNRMAILSETFAHDRFYKRIHSANAFIEEILEFTNLNGATIQQINREADARTIARVRAAAGRDQNGVAFEMRPLPDLVTLKAYDHIPYLNDSGEVTYVRSSQMVELENIANFQLFDSTIEARIPNAYIVPSAFAGVIQNLEHHGIEVQRLDTDETFSVEEFVISEISRQGFVQNNHRNIRLTGQFREIEKQFAAGDYLVSMESRLANLIFYLLEPEADDGLAYWNFFDPILEQQRSSGQEVIYPVYKIPEAR